MDSSSTPIIKFSKFGLHYSMRKIILTNTLMGALEVGLKELQQVHLLHLQLACP
jgi:hypothetical protein